MRQSDTIECVFFTRFNIPLWFIHTVHKVMNNYRRKREICISRKIARKEKHAHEKRGHHLKKNIFHDHKRSLEKHSNDEQKCQMIRLFLSNDNHL